MAGEEHELEKNRAEAERQALSVTQAIALERRGRKRSQRCYSKTVTELVDRMNGR